MRASVLKRLMEIEDERLREVLMEVVEELDQEFATRKMLESFREETRSWFSRVEEALAKLAEAQEQAGERLERLEGTVAQLAEAQKKAEERLTRLEETVAELAEAQKKTEERLTQLEKTVEQLAEAQKKAEERLTRLEETVAELAEAQKKTEERLTQLEETVEQLAEAQQKTETRLQELAEAQKKTEERLLRLEEVVERLTGVLERLQRQVGGLSRSVAYALENEAYRYLPGLLKKRFGIEVVERMIRTEVEGKEVNLLARARWNGEEVMVVGEAVLRLDDFSKLAQVEEAARVVEEAYGVRAVPVLVCHFARKALLEAAERAGIRVIQSFEWQ